MAVFRSLALAAAAASAVLAQTTTSSTTAPGNGSNAPTASVFFPFASQIPSLPISKALPVVVIGSSPPQATTYAVACSAIAGNAASAFCPTAMPTFTFTAGPSLFEAEVAIQTRNVEATISQSCEVRGTTFASCISRVVVPVGPATVTQSSSNTYGPSLAFFTVQLSATNTALVGPNTVTTSRTSNPAPGYVQAASGLGLFGTLLGVLGTMF